MDRLSALEAVALYESLADVFGKPVRVGVRPVSWSPATLKELASEAFRRQNFVAEWVAAGGLATFGKGKKFDGGVLRRVTEEDYEGFKLRITQWLATNPRSQFPPLPGAARDASANDVSTESFESGDNWSVNDLVHNHPYFKPSPDRSGNGKSGNGKEKPA